MQKKSVSTRANSRNLSSIDKIEQSREFYQSLDDIRMGFAKLDKSPMSDAAKRKLAENLVPQMQPMPQILFWHETDGSEAQFPIIFAGLNISAKMELGEQQKDALEKFLADKYGKKAERPPFLFAGDMNSRVVVPKEFGSGKSRETHLLSEHQELHTAKDQKKNPGKIQIGKVGEKYITWVVDMIKTGKSALMPLLELQQERVAKQGLVAWDEKPVKLGKANTQFYQQYYTVLDWFAKNPDKITPPSYKRTPWYKMKIENLKKLRPEKIVTLDEAVNEYGGTKEAYQEPKSLYFGFPNKKGPKVVFETEVPDSQTYTNRDQNGRSILNNLGWLDLFGCNKSGKHLKNPWAEFTDYRILEDLMGFDHAFVIGSLKITVPEYDENTAIPAKNKLPTDTRMRLNPVDLVNHVFQ